MDYILERSVVFEPEPRMAQGALVEVDGDGFKDREYIPFRWSCWFLATEATLYSGVDIDVDGTRSEEGINATLLPDGASQNVRAPEYRFFGTNRLIEKFHLEILASDTASIEVDGFPSHSFEGANHRIETASDELMFTYVLPNKEFAKLREMVRDGKLDSLALRLVGVEGFYATWSPTIFPDDIKVLTSHIEIKEMPADQKDKFPALSIKSQMPKGSLIYKNSVSLRSEPT